MKLKHIILLANIVIVICILYSSCKEEYICDETNTVCEDSSFTIDSSHIHKKVLIIGIDGLRSDAVRQDIAPFLFQYSEQNNTYFNSRNLIEELTFSGPNWSSLLTGTHFCKHQVTDNDYSDNNLSEYPHFFKYLEDVDHEINTVSLVNWLPINQFSALPFSDYAPQNSINDLEVFNQARDLLMNQNPIDPDILFLHFDELDGAGHNSGFHPDIQEYANTVNTLDTYIQSLVSIIDDKRLNGEDWLICIVSDHGGDGTSHSGGFDNDDIKYTIFYLNHPTASFKESYSSRQVDLVPTIFKYLGIEHQTLNCKTDGISIIDNL